MELTGFPEENIHVCARTSVPLLRTRGKKKQIVAAAAKKLLQRIILKLKTKIPLGVRTSICCTLLIVTFITVLIDLSHSRHSQLLQQEKDPVKISNRPFHGHVSRRRETVNL